MLLELGLKTDGKERSGSNGMARGTSCQCSLMASDRSDRVPRCQNIVGKAVERRGSINVTRGMERQCSSIELDGIIQVGQESVVNAEGKVVERT